MSTFLVELAGEGVRQVATCCCPRNCCEVCDCLACECLICQSFGCCDAFDCCESTRCRDYGCCWHTSISLAVLFSVTGLIVFAVGVARYNLAQSRFPDLDFVSPSGALIAFHWLFLICITSALLLIAYATVADRCSCGHLVSTLASCFLSLVFYILYVVWFFSSPEYTSSITAWSLADYSAARDLMITGAPHVDYTGWVDDQTSRCRISGAVVLRCVNWTDKSNLPDVLLELETVDAVHFRPELVVNWVPGTEEMIESTSEEIANCMTARVVDNQINWTLKTDGWVEGALISRDGSVPSALGRGRGVAAGIFWSGILHAYDVDSLPIVRGYVVRDNATLAGLSGCGAVSSYCTRRN